MGFFAVLRNPDDPNFEVIHCHLNLWSLGGLLSHRRFLWDVGLRLRADENTNLSRLQLAIPFSTRGNGIDDLQAEVLNPQIAQLIFGGPVDVAGTTISYEALNPVNVVRAPKTQASLDMARSHLGFSIWNLQFTPAIVAGSESYVRVRFEVRHLGRTWIWKRSGLAKNGALIDLRIAEIRETWDVPDADVLQDQIVPIQNLFLFVIAPTSLQLRATSPPLRYMRLLEGRAWEPYVGHATDIRRSGKLMVYYWRYNANDQNPPIDSIKPFRAFLDLSQEFGMTSWRDHLRTFLLLLIAIPILYYIFLLIRENYNKEFDFREFASSIGLPITLVSVSSFLLWLFKQKEPVRKTLDWIKEGFLKIESAILRALAAIGR